MSRSRRGQLQESDLPADVRARLAARRAESETPEFQAKHAEEVARLRREFPPLEPDEPLWEVLAALRLERERQGLTLADVSARTKIDPTTVSKLENGRLPNPTYSTMRSYARALGLRLGWTVEPAPADLETIARPLRGGKQKDRDRKYGIEDDDFWHYWHREGKKLYGRDISSRDEAEKRYQEWLDLGSQVPKELTTGLEDD